MESKHIAVLIDAENVPYHLVDEIFDEVALLGRATYRRVYGDFSTPSLAGWNNVAHDFALRQITQKNTGRGKNSSDIVLVIDAMDILHAGKVDAFCIVSSDSDFTRLAMRIAEAGVEVIGMGEEGKTGKSFVSACTTFKYLVEKNAPNGVSPGAAEPAKPAKAPTAGIDSPVKATPKPSAAPAAEKTAPKPLALTKKNVVNTIKNALTDLEGDADGWVFVGRIGSVLHNRWPDFDPRGAGGSSKQLSAFLKELPSFELKNIANQHYLRLKKMP
jgi:hypothetical protein